MKVEVNQEDRDAAASFFRDERTGLAVKFNLGYEPEPLLEALARHRIAAFNAGLERAADMVDGQDGKVIPHASVFASLVSGNNQPCMSGDPRDRLHPNMRSRFDAAMNDLATAIRAERNGHE